MRNKRTIKGITLIALVITIVVLLILAGVSIVMLTGNNGIITQAQNAKTKTKQAGEDELRKLTQIEASTHLEEYEYTDISGTKIKIPAKCAVSQVEGENTLEGGLVIIDSNGNEWVWIEVPKSITAKCNTRDEILSELYNYAVDYKLSYNTDEWYDGCGLTEEEYNEKMNKMLYSIKENGGFWIGRYETGTETIRTNSDDNLTNIVIQQDKFPYNFVTVSQAQSLANQLSANEYTCSLIFDIQWNLTCKFIEEKGGKTQDELKSNSNSWGNYIGNEENKVSFSINRGQYSLDDGLTFNKVQKYFMKESSVPVLLTTGASERNKVLNIYDFAGNVNEWTLGKIRSSKPSLCRSGNYAGDGKMYPSWTNVNNLTNTSVSKIGFRVTFF